MYLLHHSSILLDKEVKNIFLNDKPVKGKKIYDFMKTKVKITKIANALRAIEIAKEELKNLTPEYIGSLTLLMAYFNEDESLLFKENVSLQEINRGDLLTPYLVTFGGNLFTAKEYAVVIDGEIATYCKVFLDAAAVMFVSYFVFNIEYNASAALTLEFIQRCIMEINPSRGTKVSKKERVKHSTITKKVVKLATEINEFEKIFRV